jgi:hypothetical protein
MRVLSGYISGALAILWLTASPVVAQGDVGPPISPELLKLFTAAANKGDATAQVQLAFAYQIGNGVPIDLDKAIELYRKAAAADNVEAFAQLGFVHSHGIGVPIDREEGSRWLRKAAERGHTRAMTNLGVAYEYGYGVVPDRNVALMWYQKAADAGDPLGMSNLAYMHHAGKGVPRDLSLALKWYLRAAEHDEPAALLELGGFQINGIGTEKNVAKGFELIRRSAMTGLVDAAVNLAVCYRDGKDIERDDVEALAWFIVAVERKSPTDERIPFDLESARDAIKDRLNDEQRKAAHDKAEAILRKIGLALK